MGIFDKVLKIVKDSTGPKEKSAVAIDFGSSSVKVVQLRKEKGRAILETYGELACGPYAELSVGQATSLPAEKMLELLRDLFREANVTAKVGAMAIPLRNSLLVSVEMPEMEESKLAEMVPIEARKYVPLPISEVILDWRLMPKSSLDERESAPESADSRDRKKSYGDKVEILIASIQKDIVRLYQDIAQKLGLASDVFEIETFSSIRSVMPNDLSATAILDIGAGTSKIAIVDYGLVRLSHTIVKGSQDITIAIAKSLSVPFAKAEEIKRKFGLLGDVDNGELLKSVSPTVEYIFAEAGKVMLQYQKEHKRAVDKIILIGGGAMMKGVGDVAREVIGLPVVMGAPFDKVEAPVFLSNVLKETGPEFAVAIGLALRKLEDL
jgi:type IV pilus assembly protein PilM